MQFKDGRIETLFSEEQIQKRIKELADQINKEFEGQTITFICVLRGSLYFTSDLTKLITVPCKVDFLDVSSYHGGTVSSGTVKVNKDIEDGIEGENVIIVEDIVDTGRSLQAMQELLSLRNPKCLKICSLLNKPSQRVVEGLTVDYVGFEIPKKFVVGYGLDFDQYLRNLPFIGEMIFD